MDLNKTVAAEVLAKANAEIEELAGVYLPSLKIFSLEEDWDEDELGEQCVYVESFEDDQEFKSAIRSLSVFETTEAEIVGDDAVATVLAPAQSSSASSNSCEEPVPMDD